MRESLWDADFFGAQSCLRGRPRSLRERGDLQGRRRLAAGAYRSRRARGPAAARSWRRSGSRNQFFERPVFGLAQRLDVEALGLQRPEQLLDGPALAIEADDATCIGDIVHGMGGEQAPVRGRSVGGRIDLVRFNQRQRYTFRQRCGGGSLAMFWTSNLDRAEPQRQ